MNELTIFKNPKFGEVRTVLIDGKEHFVASDVAANLGYKNPREAIGDHCRWVAKCYVGVRTGTKVDGSPAMQQIEMNCIPIGDVCRLVTQSELPGAPEYESWIFDEVIPAIHRTGSYSLPGSGAEAQLLRARAMFNNSKVRAYKVIMSTINDKTLSPIAMQVFGLTAIEEVTGQHIDYRPACEELYSATEIAAELGIPAQTLGKFAVRNGLKTSENGAWVLDKSPYSSKEVSAFRYTAKGREVLMSLYRKQTAN